MKIIYTALILILLVFTACEKGENMNKIVVFETNKGNIEIQLDHNNAPITVENFLNYVEKGHYNGLVFHRVIKGFMIQGGGFTPDGKQRQTNPPIELESDNGLKNEIGTIAMARTSVPDSATSQFFINTNKNDFLDKGARDEGYAVFGKVVSGMNIVSTIENSQTTTKYGMPDWPKEDIIINKAYVKK